MALTVCAYAANILKQLPRPVDNVLLVAQSVLQHLLMLQQQRVLYDTGDLAEEGNGLLVELLRVADVGGNDCVEGEVALVALCQTGTILLALDCELTAHGVLGRFDVRVDVVNGESLHFVGGGKSAEGGGGEKRRRARNKSVRAEFGDGGCSYLADLLALAPRSSSNIDKKSSTAWPVWEHAAVIGAGLPHSGVRRVAGAWGGSSYRESASIGPAG